MNSVFHPSPLLPLAIVPKRHIDHRGWFSETFQDQRLRDLGITCAFVQDNQSRSHRKGTLHGFHFQGPPAAQDKLVGVSQGRILDVVVDIRRGSPTYGKCTSVELSSESGKQLFIPTGFAHAFVTLENDVTVFYKVSNYYSASCEGGIRWNDPDIEFPWPFKVTKLIRSDRDDRLPYLKDIESPFAYAGNPLTKMPTVNLS
jgi:dTDP-4-dehydrorhamnose 3,5-epimerase